MIKITRKKKDTRKYQPRNEIRYNYSPSSAGHPDQVFGYKNGKYKSLGLTHTPKKDKKSTLLNHNPDPNDKKPSYIQHKVKTTQERYMSDPIQNWSIHKDDRYIIRHITKQYKKHQNKKRR